MDAAVAAEAAAEVRADMERELQSAGLRGVLETFVPFAIIAGIVCLLVLL